MCTGKYAHIKSYYNSIMLSFRWKTHCRSGKYVVLWSTIISNTATTGKFSTWPMLGVTLLLEIKFPEKSLQYCVCSIRTGAKSPYKN